MQSRRHEGYASISSSSRLRAHHRPEVCSDPIRRTRRDGIDRSPIPRRSTSPRRLGGRLSGVSVSKTIDSYEREDYGWDVGGNRRKQIRSRSPPPPIVQERKRPHFDEGIAYSSYSPLLDLHSRYESSRTKEYIPEDENWNAKHVHGYDHVNSRIISENNFGESRPVGGHGIRDQKLITDEYHLLPVSMTSHYKASDPHNPLPSSSVITRKFEHERLKQQDLLPMDKFPVIESYKGQEKHMFFRSDGSYTAASASYSKGFPGTSQSRESGNTSSGMMRCDFPVSHPDDVGWRQIDELSRGSRKVIEPVDTNGYGKRPLSVSMKDPQTGQGSVASFQQGAYSSTMRPEHEEYLHSYSQGTAYDELGYRSDGLHKGISHDQPHDQVQMEYDNVDLLPPSHSIIHPVIDRSCNMDNSYGTSRKDFMHDFSASQKQKILNYSHMSRLATATKQGEEYLSSEHNHLEIGRKTLRDYVVPQSGATDADQPTHVESEYHFGRDSESWFQHERFDNSSRTRYDSKIHNLEMSSYHDMRRPSAASKHGEECLSSERNYLEVGRKRSRDYGVPQISATGVDELIHLQSEYDFERDSDSRFQQERFHRPSSSRYDFEMHKHEFSKLGVKKELGNYDQADRVLKKKHRAEEDIYAHDSRTIMSSEWDAPDEFQDLYDSGEDDWMANEAMHYKYSSGSVGLNHGIHRKLKKEYDLLDKDYISNDRSPPQGHFQIKQHSFGKYNNDQQYAKVHSKSTSSQYKSHNFQKSAHLKQSQYWSQDVGYVEKIHSSIGKPPGVGKHLAKLEPSEDSEKFKQMVHEAFLVYSKRLNLSHAVQRRFKDQGKMGTLYCFVCGRSVSKWFVNTQALISHAFMSQKAGLRAKHLGLHRAICVLLGWDAAVPHEITNWVPQVLPNVEALAQKEDLIIWPPIVIIQNVSLFNNNPEKWRVVSIETIEAFLRGKGFVRGRIKVCLGKPADQSTFVVKFLGTSTGWGDSERLNKYFSASKRGRVDFERAASKNSKSDSSSYAIQEDNMESLLYGYMGTAEDLVKVDFNTARRCAIRSKKEIEELDNAPLKPDEG